MSETASAVLPSHYCCHHKKGQFATLRDADIPSKHCGEEQGKERMHEAFPLPVPSAITAPAQIISIYNMKHLENEDENA